MTFDFVIDCFPAYTAFSKSKKVLAQLNVIDPDADVHNYSDKNIHGHEGRTSDTDINTTWGGSIFEAQVVSAAEGDEPSTPSTPSESETASTASVVEDNTPAEPIEENTSVEPGAEESE